MYVLAYHHERSPAVKAAFADEAVAFGYAAGGGHEECEGEVGGGIGEDAGGVGDGYAPAGGFGNVYIVVAYGHVGDDLEVGGGVHYFGVYGVGEQAEEAVVVIGPQFVY